MTAWHESILAPRQRAVLGVLGPFATAHGYHLAGGTAVALHLGHRESIDLDFFASEPRLEGAALRDALQAVVSSLTTADVDEGTFHGTADGVKVSFLRFSYPPLERPERWDTCAVEIAGLHDLAAMKLSAIAQRGLKKDFIDLHAMLNRGLPLEKMLAAYRRRFAVTDLMHLRASLVYFDDAEDQPMPTMLPSAPSSNWAAIKNDIRRAARSALRLTTP